MTGRRTPSASTSWRCAPTTSCAPARSRCSSSTTWPWDASCPSASPRWSRASPRAAAGPGCALLGGETAEHPGVMAEDEFDLAGFCVGVVDERRSSAPHRVPRATSWSGWRRAACTRTATRSCAALLQDGSALDATAPGLDRPLADELLEPCAIYAPEVLDLLARGLLHAAAHVTGGGFENLPRVLPEGLGAHDPPGHLARAADLRSAPEATGACRTTTCSPRSTWASAWCWWSIRSTRRWCRAPTRRGSCGRGGRRPIV